MSADVYSYFCKFPLFLRTTVERCSLKRKIQVITSLGLFVFSLQRIRFMADSVKTKHAHPFITIGLVITHQYYTLKATDTLPHPCNEACNALITLSKKIRLSCVVEVHQRSQILSSSLIHSDAKIIDDFTLLFSVVYRYECGKR